MNMAVVLQTVSGGPVVALAKPQRVSVGHTSVSRVVFQDAPSLSRLHFVLEHDGKTCRLESFGAGGTFVNGRRVERAELKDGDRITAGQADFIVRLAVPPDQIDGLVLIGSWSFSGMPEGWELVEGFGLRRKGDREFADNIGFTEDTLEDGQTLDDYIDRQQLGLKAQFGDNAVFERAGPVTISGAEETVALEFRPETANANSAAVIQRQIYARRGRSLGVVTLTTREAGAEPVNAVFDDFRSKLEFREPAPPSEPDQTEDNTEIEHRRFVAVFAHPHR